jgi:hypothetical protein
VETRRGITKTATFRVPRSTWQRAKKRAVDEERSLNDVVVKALEAYAGPEHADEAPMKRLLESARRIAARQPKRGLTVRSPPRDELHERGE